MIAARHTFAPTPTPRAISLTTTSRPPSNENARSLAPPSCAAARPRRPHERLAHRHETLIIVTLGNVARGGFAHVRGVPLPRLVGVRSVGGHLLGELPCGSGPAPGWNLGVPDGVEPVTDVLTGDEGGVPVALVGHSVVLISHPRRVCVPVWFPG